MASTCAPRAPLKDVDRLLPASAARGWLACEVRRVRRYGRWLADRIVGARLEASSHRRQAMLSRSSVRSSCLTSHRATPSYGEDLLRIEVIRGPGIQPVCLRQVRLNLRIRANSWAPKPSEPVRSACEGDAQTGPLPAAQCPKAVSLSLQDVTYRDLKRQKEWSLTGAARAAREARIATVKHPREAGTPGRSSLAFSAFSASPRLPGSRTA